ncbi:MAG: ABC transporter substrate-binding protein [Ideonella sp.]|nr:ABC transporter substrate-binding protein [Ideonella sp.]MCC7459141.1 ABC transporter substrate-binding protein [Nitrospira sp.]
MKPRFRLTRFLVATALAVAAIGAAAQDKVTLQLKWVTQAQFAGYYVAKDKGFYKEAGLDVTIKAGGPDINPSQVIAGGGADVIVDWMPSALATREKGVPLVNIAQVFQRSGMMLTCRKDSGIKSPADFKGKTLGVWFSGNEYPFLSWMDKLGLKTTGGPDGVNVLKQGFNVDPLLQKQAACISTMTYNEYWQLIEAGMKPEQLTVFKYEDQGVATLEDGLYATEKGIADPKTAAKLARFVKATMKGWDYAVAHQDEAVKIVLKNDASGAQNEAHQKRMMGEVAKLVGTGKTGHLDMKAYERTVETLMKGKSDPVITKKPAGAVTDKIFAAAQK